MKAILTASTLAALSLTVLPSCYGPGGPPPPGGPRGYALDRPPGRYGAPAPNPESGAPSDTRFLDPVNAPPTADPNASATVQPPNPNAAPPPDASATTQPPASSTPPPNTAPQPPVTSNPPANPPAPVTPPPSSNSYPTAKRTKAGFVESPFAPGREIDVREMRSGQKARCPYTQKVFLVP